MWCCVFFQAEDGIRDLVRSRGLGDVYKRQLLMSTAAYAADPGVSDTEIKIGDVNIMTGPAAFVGLSLIHI